MKFGTIILLFISLFILSCEEKKPEDLVINQAFSIEKIYQQIYDSAMVDQSNNELTKAMHAFILLHDRSFKKDTVALALCDLCILQSKPYSPDTLHQQTRDYCKEALQTMPDNIYYHYATANAMVRLGEAKDALSFIGDAIKIFPKDHLLKRYRGIARTSVGDFKGAEEDLNTFIADGEAKKHKHSLVWAYIDRARLLKRENKYREAVKDYNASLKLKEIGVLLVERGESILEMLNRADEYPFSFTNKDRLIKNVCNDFRRAGELGSQKAYTLLKKHCR